ncbi:hypothetical protein [Thermodesulforhabdus norvegica]|uniref:Uncharacterized protein n=1 Tax=Thermodesulforhabdus norvegica TaxID=39841 RepID=A0A1I4VEW1_9BACT|nr:hypothetical protein [Thermodesulforhabdus norvegica]SFM99719.1 hypothetical protein SAMN05660836_02262 [Thermodesulforhabdus norvegica]
MAAAYPRATSYALQYLEDLKHLIKAGTPRFVQDFLNLARTAGLEVRTIVVETAVNEAKMQEILATCLQSHACGLQRAFAREMERLSRRSEEVSPESWDRILTLLRTCLAAGFTVTGVEGDRLVLGNCDRRRINTFWKEGRLYRYGDRRRALLVRKILLVVGSPVRGGFTDWECLVDCDRHPNVGKDGRLCAGELRGRDLLAEDTVRAIVTAVEVPSLDSAYWRPGDGELEPASDPDVVEPPNCPRCGRPAEMALEERRVDVETFRTAHGRSVAVKIWRCAGCGWAELTPESQRLLEAERRALLEGYIPHSHCECCGCCTDTCYCSCCCSP